MRLLIGINLFGYLYSEHEPEKQQAAMPAILLADGQVIEGSLAIKNTFAQKEKVGRLVKKLSRYNCNH